ncbi:hypothetical protein MMC17_001908 [Xylographa soralifera]|nr:hypothetical protein [Xylographa soralifera]
MAVKDGAESTPKVARGSAAETKELSNRAIKAWLDEAPKQAPWSIHGRTHPTKGSWDGQGTHLQSLEHEMELDVDRLRHERGFSYRA